MEPSKDLPRINTAAEAQAHPGLKMQTPYESQKTDLRNLTDRQRWKYLFSLNVYQKPKTK